MIDKKSLFEKTLADMTNKFSQNLAAFNICRGEIDRFDAFTSQHGMIRFLVGESETKVSCCITTGDKEPQKLDAVLKIFRQENFIIGEPEDTVEGVRAGLRKIRIRVNRGDLKIVVFGVEKVAAP